MPPAAVLQKSPTSPVCVCTVRTVQGGIVLVVEDEVLVVDEVDVLVDVLSVVDVELLVDVLSVLEVEVLVDEEVVDDDELLVEVLELLDVEELDELVLDDEVVTEVVVEEDTIVVLVVSVVVVTTVVVVWPLSIAGVQRSFAAVAVTDWVPNWSVTLTWCLPGFPFTFTL